MNQSSGRGAKGDSKPPWYRNHEIVNKSFGGVKLESLGIIGNASKVKVLRMHLTISKFPAVPSKTDIRVD